MKVVIYQPALQQSTFVTNYDTLPLWVNQADGLRALSKRDAAASTSDGTVRSTNLPNPAKCLALLVTLWVKNYAGKGVEMRTHHHVFCEL